MECLCVWVPRGQKKTFMRVSMGVRQVGHSVTVAAHAWHAITWPHGQKAVSGSLSRQMAHSLGAVEGLQGCFAIVVGAGAGVWRSSDRPNFGALPRLYALERPKVSAALRAASVSLSIVQFFFTFPDMT